MFTGIITDLGKVKGMEQRGDTRITIATTYDTDDIEIGASIACSGPCLTVVDKGDGWFAVDASAETLARTNLGAWQAGTPVNLERSLKVGDELGGHIVTGHVDGTGEVVAITPEGDSKRFRFRVADRGLAELISQKGCVAIDGVSLTVNEVEDVADGSIFGVNIIPHTQAMTTFGDMQVGDSVNLEVDVLARYVARLREFG